MSSWKGGSTTNETKSSEPPAWAKPSLEKAGSENLRLYNEGSGYHTYTGPTQAPLSGTTLAGYNRLNAATGGIPNVTNESLQSIISDVKSRMPAQKQKSQNTSPNTSSTSDSNRLWTYYSSYPNYYQYIDKNDGRL